MDYRCTNGLCGAYDCSRCRPMNDNEVEHDEAVEAMELDKGDLARDAELEDDMSTEMLAGVDVSTAGSANGND